MAAVHAQGSKFRGRRSLLAILFKEPGSVKEEMKIPPLPMWLPVQRETRTSLPIRAVYDFLAQAVPEVR